jgi:hypothetical protein
MDGRYVVLQYVIVFIAQQSLGGDFIKDSGRGSLSYLGSLHKRSDWQIHGYYDHTELGFSKSRCMSFLSMR